MIAIGLMSGTSMDGIDAALVRITRTTESAIRADLLDFVCRPYPGDLRRRLRSVAAGVAVSAGEFGVLDVEVGEAFAGAAAELQARPAAREAVPEIIGSHGQTVVHLPERGVSLQLGAAAVIAERTAVPVISDFRARDLAAGGQGAPLVPYVDRLLFVEPGRTVAVLNLGGIANLTILPPSAAVSAGEVRAHDTGPGNMVVDEVVAIVTDGAEQCDREGRRAARGRVDQELLQTLLAEPYFAAPAPKSTGRGAFGDSFAAELVRRGRVEGLGDDDLVATATALTVESVAAAVRTAGVTRLLVAGGGVHNPRMLDGLRERLAGVEVESTAAVGVDPDAREALAFAVLAWAHLEGEVAGLPSVTGARHGCVLGARVP